MATAIMKQKEVPEILSAIDILNFYLDLRYDIRKNTNTKKDRK